MIWRILQVSDIPAARGLNLLAGWNQTEADWSGYLAFEPGGCFAVEIDGVLAGTAVTIRYGEALGWIGMVLVHPGYRRRGLGTLLLQRTIDYLKDRGTGSIKLDATPMGREVYLPLGFRDEYEVTRWEGRTPPRAAADDPQGEPGNGPTYPASREPDPVRILGYEAGVAGGLSSAVADLDAEAFGASRTVVLAALGGRAPGLSFIAGRGRTAEGYLIAREGREAIQLGPWVARDLPSARSLWAAFCRAAPDRRVFLDVPVPNPGGGALLAPFGFGVQRSFMRMFLGDPGPRGNPHMIYGTGGAEKG